MEESKNNKNDGNQSKLEESRIVLEQPLTQKAIVEDYLNCTICE